MNRRRFLSSAAACVAGALTIMRNDRLLIVGESFENQTVRMTDGQTYEGCKFHDCKIVIAGEGITISSCHFTSTVPVNMPAWRINADGQTFIA